MAALARPLLGAGPEDLLTPWPSGAEGPPRAAGALPRCAHLAAAGALASLALLGARGWGWSSSAGPPRGWPGGAGPLPLTELTDRAPAQCFTYTGGNCYAMTCHAERQAQCVNGFCICRMGGGCVGAEGSCHKDIDEYELVANNIRIRNVKFNEYLYVPEAFYTSQLRVSDDPGKNSDRWNVYRVPGTASGQGYHIFSPVDYPKYVVSYSAGITSPAQVIVWNIRGSPLQDPWDLFQSLCEPSLRPGAWEITMLQATGRGMKWYVGRGSWAVFGNYLGWLFGGAVGEGGQWMPEPPINLSLPRCG